MPTKDVSRLLRHAHETRIALDMDGVVADPFTHMVALWNEKTGSHYTLEKVNTYGVDFSEVGMTPRDFYNLYEKVWLELQDEIRLLADPKLMAEFSETHNVEIVTSRPKGMLDATRSFVSNNYPGFHGDVVTVDHPKEKAKRGYGLFIDDSPLLPAFIEEFCAKGARTPVQILIEQPWNRNYHNDMPDNVHVMRETNDALRLLISESKGRGSAPRLNSSSESIRN